MDGNINHQTLPVGDEGDDEMGLQDVLGDGYKQVMTGFILMIVGAALTIMPQYVTQMDSAVSFIGLVVLLGSVMIMILGVQIEGTGATGADENFDVMSAIAEMRDQLHEKIDTIAGAAGLSQTSGDSDSSSDDSPTSDDVDEESDGE